MGAAAAAPDRADGRLLAAFGAGVVLAGSVAVAIAALTPGDPVPLGALGVVLLVAVTALAALALHHAASVTIDHERRARQDPLTGLANRAAFRRALDERVADGRNAWAQVAVLLLDLDRFREVNDTLGHDAGDRLLVLVGERLRAALADEGMVARLGGDEFAILLDGADSARARRCAGQAVAALEASFPVDDGLLDVEASVGIAVFPEHGATTETLLQRADIAMYRAKARQHAVECYAAEHDHHNRRQLALLADLRAGLGRGELVVHYMPQVNLMTGRVETVEALVRWNHPEEGLLAPGEFVPLAERTGLIRPLTTHVLAQSLRQIARWRRRGLDLVVSVNLSARNLHDPGLSGQLRDVLERQGLPARHLQLELTESSIMDDPERALTVLRELDELGVRLAVDDFGTGYSSLAYLQRLPVDEIKIDRSFVSGMAERPADEVIVCSTIELGRNLGLTVTAEGVETESVLAMLRAHGCHHVQGHFVGPAMPAAELEALLECPLWAGGMAAGLARGQGSLFGPQLPLEPVGPGAEDDEDDMDDVVLDLDGDATIDLGGGRHPSRRHARVPPRL
ncbi:MAG: EAL domain-containing protein [Acidimicrobiales bacterium]|nr:EAL domain-containing protein [Acidimicrobiales bacterium]MCB9372157.1 EAL domain-containing protein [Microthrixaceae bacterium]